ncbi:MAG: hypothetical protein VYA54_01150 [Bdellovibrionota bacterium]|nr:hypothetical protein [Bdellovibrionota bacterium]
MIRFSNFIVYSNSLIALCAPSLFLLYALKLGQNFAIITPIFLYGITFVAYNFMRIAPSIGGSNPSNSTQTFLRIPAYHILTLVMTMIVSYFALPEIEHNIVFAVSCVLAFLYEQRFLKLGLRKVPLLKTFIVACVWANISCLLLEQWNWWNYLDCFIFIFLLTLAFDYRDMEQDGIDKVKTIPSIIPDHYFAPLLCFFYILYIGTIAFLFEESLMFITIGIFVYALFSQKLKEVYFHLMIDGIIILRFLFYLIQH